MFFSDSIEEPDLVLTGDNDHIVLFHLQSETYQYLPMSRPVNAEISDVDINENLVFFIDDDSRVKKVSLKGGTVKEITNTGNILQMGPILTRLLQVLAMCICVHFRGKN
jgi:hypothetical protein